MDEIFSGWLRSEEFARAANEQADTLVLTWTPYITRWRALVVACCGARKGRVNVATIKVMEIRVADYGAARVKVSQQPDFEHTDTQLLSSLGLGRSVPLDVQKEATNLVVEELRRRADMRQGYAVPEAPHLRHNIDPQSLRGVDPQ